MAARPLLLTFALLLTAAAAPPRRLPDAQSLGLQMQAQTAARLQAAQEEERRLAGERVEAAAKLRDAENEAAAASQRVSELAARRDAAQKRLAEHAAALGPLLPLAERLAVYPAETLLAVPGSPERAVRGLAVLHGLMTTLEQDAAGLRAEMAETEQAQRELEAELPRLRAAQAAQAVQSAQLDREIESARVVRIRAEDAAVQSARRAAAEAARADTLRAALAAMQAARIRSEQQLQANVAKAEAQQRAAAAAQARREQATVAAPAGPGVRQGANLIPVAGGIVRRWGDQTDAGPATGVSFRAPPLARVVAPCAGRVVFAGPFRSFGQLVIIDCGGGYHFVLAGLDRLDVQVGNPVRAGEPVGVMPGWDPAKPGPHPALYLELRRDGQPVDPAPFLAGNS